MKFKPSKPMIVEWLSLEKAVVGAHEVVSMGYGKDNEYYNQILGTVSTKAIVK